MWILAILLFKAVLGHDNSTDWFSDLVAEQTTYVNSQYDRVPGAPAWALLEACGGPAANAGDALHACTLGDLDGVGPGAVKYARLVFTPYHLTSPIVLVFHDVTKNSTTYSNSSGWWDGDFSRSTSWNESISLTSAYSTYKAGVGRATHNGQIRGFVWRAMTNDCVSEPSFVFYTPVDFFQGMLFVGGYH